MPVSGAEIGLATVIHALITKQLDNCNALCLGLHLKKLQLIQNEEAASFSSSNIGSMLRHFWDPALFANWVLFKVLEVDL